jgi:hypothetical protein
VHELSSYMRARAARTKPPPRSRALRGAPRGPLHLGLHGGCSGCSFGKGASILVGKVFKVDPLDSDRLLLCYLEGRTVSILSIVPLFNPETTAAGQITDRLGGQAKRLLSKGPLSPQPRGAPRLAALRGARARRRRPARRAAARGPRRRDEPAAPAPAAVQPLARRRADPAAQPGRRRARRARQLAAVWRLVVRRPRRRAAWRAGAPAAAGAQPTVATAPPQTPPKTLHPRRRAPPPRGAAAALRPRLGPPAWPATAPPP